MAGFVQIIEFETSRIDEVRALSDKMQEQASSEGTTVRRASYTQDRDRPNTYVSVVEFDSYESAMENSNSPRTQEFAAQFAELCDGPPRFRNLDVSETFTP